MIATLKITTIDHSPGPWRIGDAGLAVFAADAPRYIADCSGQRNAKDDVKLIALAPEMYKTLMDIATQGARHGAKWDGDDMAIIAARMLYRNQPAATTNRKVVEIAMKNSQVISIIETRN